MNLYLKFLSIRKKRLLISGMVFLFFLTISWPKRRSAFIFLIRPSSWLERQISSYRFLLTRKEALKIENEKLKEKYHSLLGSCHLFSSTGRSPTFSKRLDDNYLLIQGKIIVIRGGDVVVEVPQARSLALKGVAVFENWLIGDWQKKGGTNFVTLNLWFQPPFPLRVKVTDEKGQFITGGVIKLKRGKLILDQVLRGVELRPDQFIYLLSAEYDNFPPIGRTYQLEESDAVYQRWSIKLPWKSDIQVDRDLTLISKKQ